MMKKIIAIIGVILSVFSGLAATWTIHGAKDNASFVEWTDWTHAWIVQWDWAWDQLYPQWADSGVAYSDGTGWGPFSGYADVLTVDVPDGWNIYCVAVSGPGPDYNGGGSYRFNSMPTGDQVMPTAGEYWVDMDSTGAIRISTTQPSDFGKWAWDGSINPSWVAAKKGFAKGHNKQPLPSPK